MINLDSVIAIIPARYASTRFPAKPLVSIGGKSMIERVYRQAERLFKHVCVATDHLEIFKCVEEFGGSVVMTGEHHTSGTDRIAEALTIIEEKRNIENIKVEKPKSGGLEPFKYVVNIQGDEPFIDPQQLEDIVDCFTDDSVDIATLAQPISSSEELFNSNVVKVVCGLENRAIYFSRNPIPFQRGCEQEEWHLNHTYLKHIGLYAYKSEVLREITALPQGVLEKMESLEQLRWLESGYTIACRFTDKPTYGIDTPEDLERVLKSGILDEL